MRLIRAGADDRTIEVRQIYRLWKRLQNKAQMSKLKAINTDNIRYQTIPQEENTKNNSGNSDTSPHLLVELKPVYGAQTGLRRASVTG